MRVAKMPRRKARVMGDMRFSMRMLSIATSRIACSEVFPGID
jgi:hypothetical protein